MCGIVGLHLRTPELYPRLGTLLSGMLCEMGDRGSDSAGVAVYGDPTWAPPGQGCVSVSDLGTGKREDIGLVRRTVGTALDDEVEVVAVADSTCCRPTGRPKHCSLRSGRATPRPSSPDSVPTWRFSRASVIPVRSPRAGGWPGRRLAGRRPHADGNRIRGHSVGLPPLRRRPRSVHGAQRFVLQPRHHPARTPRPRRGLRQRERHRGRRPLHRRAAGRGPRRGECAQGTVPDVRRLLHAVGVRPRLVRRRARRDRVQTRRHRRDRRLGGNGQRIPRLAGLPGVENARIWEPEPEVVYAWSR